MLSGPRASVFSKCPVMALGDGSQCQLLARSPAWILKFNLMGLFT